jgi:hypothetical protein
MILAALLMGWVTGNASAQGPGTVEVAGLGVWHNKTVPIDALRGFGAGARLGVWLPAGFEVEGQLDMTFPRNSIVGSRFQMVNVGASALYNIPLSSGGSLYLRAGYGKLLPGGSCNFNSVTCPSFGAAVAAAGFRVPVGGVFARVEGMYRTRSTYNYSSIGGSFGFAVLRGKAGSGGRAGPDEDGDGVPNGRDRCKDTARGALVDGRGCPSDLDQDGILDGIDRCPRTPADTPVDGVGCPVKKPD